MAIVRTTLRENAQNARSRNGARSARSLPAIDWANTVNADVHHLSLEERNCRSSLPLTLYRKSSMELNMGRSILLWLLGVPIPVIILIALFWH